MAKDLNLGVLKSSTDRARYPSEETSAGESIEKLVPGGRLSGRRLSITNADRTVLWDGNPRNLDRDKDISDLLPLIRNSGGNTQPVDGRQLPDGTIEIVAGSRRRACCIEAKLPLIVDVYEHMTDDLAHYVADLENRGRKDIGLIAECEYLSRRLEEVKKKVTGITLSEFAERYGMSRRSMARRLAVADLPDYLLATCHAIDGWSLRQADTLVQLFNDLSQHGVNDAQIEPAIRINTKTVPNLLGALKGLMPRQGDDEPTTETLSVAEGTIRIKQNKTGSMTILVDGKVPVNIREKLLETLKSL